MIKSMTGFGAAFACTGDLQVRVELSSVNRKQLDVVLRLPTPLTVLESRVLKIIQEQISRGRINGIVQVESSNGSASIQVDEQRAEEAMKQLRRIAKKLRLKDDLNAGVLLQIPGLINARTTECSPEKIYPTLESALRVALKNLNTMRAHEGKALERDFLTRLKKLDGMLQKIQAHALGITSKIREKLFQGLKKSGLHHVATDERILKEVALFGERSDIAEEITRLTSHLRQFKKMLRDNESAGRSLDFLTQELFREINTIGAKANDLNVTQLVVSFKTELERVREQIQNVE